MKAITTLLLFCLIQYFVVAQSNMQKAAVYSVSNQATYTSGNTQKTNVTTVSSGTSYQSQSSTPSYNQSVPQINPTRYVANNQYVIHSAGKNIKTISEESNLHKFVDNSGYNPVIRKIVFPISKVCKEKEVVIRNSNVLLSTLKEPISVFNSNSVAPASISINGTSSSFQANNKIIPVKRYKCVYGNYADYYGPGWYSIHVASFKNLDYCKTVIRYMKNRYKLDAFVFDDLTSVTMRYHLVLGKYRKYFVAENILRYIKQEMPYAFVINWNRFSQMIFFQ